jgi:hypothetical protein
MEKETIPEFPLPALPLPDQLYGYRPACKLNTYTSELKKEDKLLFCNLVDQFFLIITDLTYKVESTQYSGYVVLKKKFNSCFVKNGKLIDNNSIDEDFRLAKEIINPTSTSQWENVDELIYIDPNDEGNTILLRQIDKQFREKEYPTLLKLSKNTRIFKKHDNNDLLYTTAPKKGKYVTLETTSDLSLLFLPQLPKPTIKDDPYYTYVKFLIGNSITGTLPLSLNETVLKEIVRELTMSCGIKDGIHWANKILLFNPKKCTNEIN